MKRQEMQEVVDRFIIEKTCGIDNAEAEMVKLVGSKVDGLLDVEGLQKIMEGKTVT